MRFKFLLLLSVAGIAGTLGRYSLINLLSNIGVTRVIPATFWINLCGCFFAGMTVTLFDHLKIPTHITKEILLIGLLGAFTTFSSFILEGVNYLQIVSIFRGILYITLQNILGIIALLIGKIITQALIS